MVNAFWLDRDPERTARWLVDRHVTSSVFECSMALTTAARLAGYPDEADGLPVTHVEHPLVRWAARSRANWGCLCQYTRHAHEEWRYRWEHGDDIHASWSMVRGLDGDALDGLDWPETGRTDPPQLTGEWSAPDVVDAYRLYYANDKRHLFAWARDRSPPPWLDAYTCPDGARCPDGSPAPHGTDPEADGR